MQTLNALVHDSTSALQQRTRFVRCTLQGCLRIRIAGGALCAHQPNPDTRIIRIDVDGFLETTRGSSWLLDFHKEVAKLDAQIHILRSFFDSATQNLPGFIVATLFAIKPREIERGGAIGDVVFKLLLEELLRFGKAPSTVGRDTFLSPGVAQE